MVVGWNMSGIVESALKLLEGFKGARSIKQKNRAVVELAVISSACDLIAASYKDAQIKAEVYEPFPEYELKIEYQAPKPQSHIDAAKLAKKLLKDGRLEELLSVISISAKSLAALTDGEALIEKFKVMDDDTKAGINVKKMTKTELKEFVAK